MTIREEFDAWLKEHELTDHPGRYSQWLRNEIYIAEREAQWLSSTKTMETSADLRVRRLKVEQSILLGIGAPE